MHQLGPKGSEEGEDCDSTSLPMAQCVRHGFDGSTGDESMSLPGKKRGVK